MKLKWTVPLTMFPVSFATFIFFLYKYLINLNKLDKVRT